MCISLKNDVFSYSNLGFCFFHNGNHLLKINKKTFLNALTKPIEAQRIIDQYPTFFTAPFLNGDGKVMNKVLSTSQAFKNNSEKHTPELKIALVALPYEEGPQRIMPLGLQNISAHIKKSIKQKKP